MLAILNLKDLLSGKYPVIHWVGLVDEEHYQKVVKEINEALGKQPDPKHIVLWVSSYEGGDLNVAWNFYSYIRAAKLPLITITGGEVISAAVVIYLSGVVRFASHLASFYIHDPLYAHFNDVTKRNVQSLQDTVKATHERHLKVLADELNVSKEEIDAWSQKTKRFSVREAKKIGIVHHIFNTKPLA